MAEHKKITNRRVPQGSILRPSLFVVICINDLFSNTKYQNAKITAYTGDTNFLLCNNSIESDIHSMKLLFRKLKT